MLCRLLSRFLCWFLSRNPGVNTELGPRYELTVRVGDGPEVVVGPTQLVSRVTAFPRRLSVRLAVHAFVDRIKVGALTSVIAASDSQLGGIVVKTCGKWDCDAVASGAQTRLLSWITRWLFTRLFRRLFSWLLCGVFCWLLCWMLRWLFCWLMSWVMCFLLGFL